MEGGIGSIHRGVACTLAYVAVFVSDKGHSKLLRIGMVTGGFFCRMGYVNFYIMNERASGLYVLDLIEYRVYTYTYCKDERGSQIS